MLSSNDSLSPSRAMPASCDKDSSVCTKEADLNLPRECFLLPKQNDGFQIPYFLSSIEEVNKIRPPAVVKTWEQRYGELNNEQQRALKEFRKMVQNAPWYDEKKVDDWMCLRYLIARSFDLRKAFTMLEGTVKWWRETGSETWMCETCMKNPNNHMGQFVGWDREHRPVMFMSMRWAPERKNPLPHMVCAFNHLIRMMPVGVEKWVSLTDFETYSHLHDGKPSMGMSVIRTIQDHYPERLGKMVCVNPPKLFSLLWKILLPVIDPATRGKVEFLWTEAQPSICDAFPRLFPQHLSEYLMDTYDRSRYNWPVRTLVWYPRPEGYPINFEERKQELRTIKERVKGDKRDAKKAAHDAKKREKEDNCRTEHEMQRS